MAFIDLSERCRNGTTTAVDVNGSYYVPAWGSGYRWDAKEQERQEQFRRFLDGIEARRRARKLIPKR